MARINFDTFQQAMKEQENNPSNGIGFFSLKNDGDEAVVRIMHNSSADFDIVEVHNMKIGERYRKINCLNGEGQGTCPLCAANNRAQHRFFVHMIQYVKDEQGQIVPKPVIWDRAALQMSKKLVSMIQEYGPLSDCVFKIRRSGAAGSMDTTYEIMFANPTIYKPELYPVLSDAFANYNVVGGAVMNKSAADLEVFLSTGSFPNVNPQQNNNQAAPATYNEAPPTNTPAYNAPAQQYSAPAQPQNYGAPTGYQAPNPSTHNTQMPNMNNGAPGRPNRYY